MSQRVSLSQLAQAGVRLRPAEAAAIVSEICRQRSDGRLRGIPSANVIRITDDGWVIAEGPVNADGPSVARAAQLLEDLMPPIDAPPELRAPGGLRLVIARAVGVLDLPPYPSLEAFCAAVDRFAIRDLPATARQLFAAWTTARVVASEPGASAPPAHAVEALVPVPPPLPPVPFDDAPALTISDIRRARRATGLTLTDVAERSRIPAVLLRELEWGYLRNWPAGRYGRAQLVRYAHAAGLDVDVVLNVAEPLLIEASAEREREYEEFRRDEERGGIPSVDADIAGDIVVWSSPVPEAGDAPDLPAQAQRPRRRAAWIAALAIPAMIALALIPAIGGWRSQVGGWRPEAGGRRSDGGRTSEVGGPRSGVGSASTVRAPTSDLRPASSDVRHPTSALRPPASDIRPISVARPLVQRPATYSPAFANTGTAVFFTERAREKSALLRADTDPDGSVLRITRVVDDRAQNFHARPSPDGTQIAFDSDRDGERAVYVADADGRHVRRVSGDGFAAVPAWSPDARQLAFVKAEPGRPQVWNLWTVDLDTLALHRLTSHPVGQPWGGSWFPDGRRLAYSHEDQLVILDLVSGTRRVYRTPAPGQLVRTPAVSPDGRRVIFQVQHNGAWMLELTDGSMRRVLDDPSAEEYTWSPDGRRVAFHSRRAGGWGVWVMAPR